MFISSCSPFVDTLTQQYSIQRYAQMSSKRILVETLEDLSQWEELFLKNLINQQNYELRLLFGGNLLLSEILDLGLINFNLSRFWISNLQMSLVVKLTPNKERIPLLIGMGDLALACGQFGHAHYVFSLAIELIQKETNMKIDLLSYCNHQIKAIKDKIKELKVELSQEFEPIVETRAKELSLFKKFEVFEVKMPIYRFFINTVPESKKDEYKYLLNIINDWNQYKETSSVVLSGIVTRGNLDLEKALSATFDFISKFPLKLLTTKLLQYSSIENIIDGNLSKFDNSIFNAEPTMEEVILKSDKFHKDHSYLKFLLIYLKSKLIINVKKLVLTNADKTFLIYEIDIIARFCALLIELFKPEIELSLLNKKLFEKRKKLIQTYQNEIESFLDHLVKIGMVAMAYMFLVYKEDMDLAEYSPNDDIRLMKLKVFKTSTFMLRSFYVMFRARKLELENKTIIKKVMVFSNETLAHLNIEEVLPEQLYESEHFKLRRLNNFFTERLLSGYISLLEQNSCDDPNNAQIIKRIMYYVLLQGGYHVSVIWFLNILYDYSQLRNTITVINHEDGVDEFDQAMFGPNIELYADKLDYIIQKIVLAKEDIEVFKFKSYENGKEVMIEKMQSVTLRTRNQLVLPQVIMNSDYEIIFLPEFSSFIQDGNTVRMNLMNAFAESNASKFDPGTYIQLKSILKPAKECLYECIKKSSVLVESILNTGKIPLVNELKKRARSRMLIEDACCGIAIPFIAEDMQQEMYTQVASKRQHLHKQANNSLKQHELCEQIQLFRRENASSEQSNNSADHFASRKHVWRMLADSGVVGFCAHI